MLHSLAPFVSELVVIGEFICCGSYVLCKLTTVHLYSELHMSPLASIHKMQLAHLSILPWIQTEETLLRTKYLFGCSSFAKNKSFLHKHFCTVSTSQTFPTQMRNTYDSLWACAIQRVSTTS